MGVVTGISTVAEFNRMVTARGMLKDNDEFKVGVILRIATLSERQELPGKLKNEEIALETVLHLVYNVFQLPMEVVGVDFQFDGKKLTVHYLSEIRIDFRELVRDLNLIYKSRIWMKKSNFVAPFRPLPFATEGLITGEMNE